MDFRLDNRTVLVIGGAGYVGSVLTGMLLQAGAKVRILDQLIYDNGFSVQHYLNDGRFTFLRGDLRDRERACEAMRGATDVVLLAALVGDPICKKNPALAESVNYDGSAGLIEMMEESGAGRFIFASTCSNYGIHDSDHLADEESELNPQSLYARTKVNLEKLLLERSKAAHWTGTVLRLATAYGFSPRMRFDLTVSQFAREMAAGDSLLVYDPDTWRPYCHIEDISRAILTVLTSAPELVRGEVFNVGSDTQQFTKRMIVEQIRTCLPESTAEYRTGDTDPRNYRVSFAKIAARLGFRCEHSVESYIPRLVEATRQGVFPSAVNDIRHGNYVIQNLT